MNKPALTAVFEHYATCLGTPGRHRSPFKRSLSAKRFSTSDLQATTAVRIATGSESTMPNKDPTRLMSLSQLYQFCQDFGVLPDVCDMVGIQSAFALVKSRLLSETEEFVDLLQFSEFEEVSVTGGSSVVGVLT